MIRLALDRNNHTGWLFAGRSYAARTSCNDLMEVIPSGETHATILIADVHGRGPAAHAARCTIHKLLRQRAVAGPHRPDVLIEEANRWVCTVRELYASLFVAVIELATGRMKYANAGHAPPLLLRGSIKKAREEVLQESGFPLGTAPSLSLEVGEIQIYEGDTLVMYTDGLLERPAENQRLSHNELREVLAANVTKNITDSIDAALANVRTITGPAFRTDDTSLLMVCRAPAYEAACTYTRAVAKRKGKVAFAPAKRITDSQLVAAEA